MLKRFEDVVARDIWLVERQLGGGFLATPINTSRFMKKKYILFAEEKRNFFLSFYENYKNFPRKIDGIVIP